MDRNPNLPTAQQMADWAHNSATKADTHDRDRLSVAMDDALRAGADDLLDFGMLLCGQSEHSYDAWCCYRDMLSSKVESKEVSHPETGQRRRLTLMAMPLAGTIGENQNLSRRASEEIRSLFRPNNAEISCEVAAVAPVLFAPEQLRAAPSKRRRWLEASAQALDDAASFANPISFRSTGQRYEEHVTHFALRYLVLTVLSPVDETDPASMISECINEDDVTSVIADHTGGQFAAGQTRRLVEGWENGLAVYNRFILETLVANKLLRYINEQGPRASVTLEADEENGTANIRVTGGATGEAPETMHWFAPCTGSLWIQQAYENAKQVCAMFRLDEPEVVAISHENKQDPPFASTCKRAGS